MDNIEPDEGNMIVRLAARGDGQLADGRHVSGSVPGDRLMPDGSLQKGPHHIDAACRHFGQCGGCQLQHADEEILARFVEERVVLPLSGHSVIPEEITPVHLSPIRSRRRVAIRSAWKGKRLILGFSGEKSHEIIDLRQCDVMESRIFGLVPALKLFLEKHVAAKKQVQVKMALVDQGVDMLIENLEIDGLEGHEALTEFARKNDLARLSIDDGYGSTSYWEPDPVTFSVDGVAIPYPPYAFLQATDDGQAALSDAVRMIVGNSVRCADLFAGLGTFTFALGEGRKIYAAEAERAAILSLKAAAAKTGRTIMTEHRDLFRRPLVPRELNNFEAVIIDPPRSGAREQISELAGSGVPKIAYVSCNPASFARDAAILIAGGYRLQRIWPIGQFRWSTHVEMVGEFLRS